MSRAPSAEMWPGAKSRGLTARARLHIARRRHPTGWLVWVAPISRSPTASACHRSRLCGFGADLALATCLRFRPMSVSRRIAAAASSPCHPAAHAVRLDAQRPVQYSESMIATDRQHGPASLCCPGPLQTPKSQRRLRWHGEGGVRRHPAVAPRSLLHARAVLLDCAAYVCHQRTKNGRRVSPAGVQPCRPVAAISCCSRSGA